MPTRLWRTFFRLSVLSIAVVASPILGKAQPPVLQSSQEPVAAQRCVPAQDRPNLVFVFSDQQSFDMLGCYGDWEPYAQTRQVRTTGRRPLS